MVVRDLFYNTPPGSVPEKGHRRGGRPASAMVRRVALSHPEVSVKFLRPARGAATPATGQSALYAVLGRDMALGFTPVKAWGVICRSPALSPCSTRRWGTRGYQHFLSTAGM